MVVVIVVAVAVVVVVVVVVASPLKRHMINDTLPSLKMPFLRGVS